MEALEGGQATHTCVVTAMLTCALRTWWRFAAERKWMRAFQGGGRKSARGCWPREGQHAGTQAQAWHLGVPARRGGGSA